MSEIKSCEENEAIDQVARSSEESIHPAQRDQHPKQHGCVWAEFQVLENLPERLRIGIFKEPKTFPAWVRFSSFQQEDDTKKDAHGMAIKLMNVKGEKLLEKDAKTQDFVLSTLRSFFVKDAKDYAELFESGSILKFLFPHLFKWRIREAKALVSTWLRRQFSSIVSPLEIQYWSATPYQLGPWVVKFFVKPSSNNVSGRKPGKTKDYLREAMVDYLKTQTASFDFYIQLQNQRNPERTPIEDPRIEWKNVETHKVATIKIPAQVFDSPEQEQFGEGLSFTPWHSLPEHRPLGSINRVRQEVYKRTAALRRQLNHVPQAEPTPETFKPTLLPSPPFNTRSAPQNALTVLIPIKSGEEEKLTTCLEELGQNYECWNNRSNSLFQKSLSTHFARFVILNDYERGLQAHLLFSSNYDGDFSDYVQELVETTGNTLNQIFSLCENYVPGTSLCAESFKKFIKLYSFNPQVFYPAFQNKTVSIIKSNHSLHGELNQLLESINNLDLESKLGKIYLYLSDDISPSEPLEERQVQFFQPLLSILFRMLESWVGIQSSAKQDPSKWLPLSPEQQERLRKIAELEDKIAQNQITIFVPIKPGLFHRYFLSIVLFIIQLRAGGFLPKLNAIHFARWVIIDRKKLKNSKSSYLLFESNYNRSWDSYIDDFVERFGPTMNLIWGNCIEFPAGGTKDIEWFKQHIRRYQFPAQVFYSAYHGLTVSRIQKDIDIQAVAQQFLALLQSQAAQQFFTGF